jgi:hypothetical protein
MFEIQLVVINEFGEFLGRKAVISEEDYKNLLVMARSFYQNGNFDLTCEDGSFIVFPPEIVQKSILKIIKKSINNV